MDLSNMSVGDLRNLQEQIKQEMKQREHQEVQQAREQILGEVQDELVEYHALQREAKQYEIVDWDAL